MRLIIAKDDQISGIHAVLPTKVGHQCYILDDRANRIRADVTPKHLRPN
jgi:hypothetical protein